MVNRVLVVESGIETSQTLTRYFEEHGGEVWHAWKLDEATLLLDLVQPDLMLLDIHFPGDSWLDFLSQARNKFPRLKIIMTTKQIDLQREVLAKQRGVDVFVRQPFTNHWLDTALKKLQQESLSGGHKIPQSAELPPVRVPIHLKIILPFLALALVFSLVALFISKQLSDELHQSYQDKQLARLAVQGSKRMAAAEDQMLSNINAITSIQGLAVAILRGDTNRLDALIMPEAARIAVDGRVAVLDLTGKNVFSSDGTGEGSSPFVSQRGVEMALQGISDHWGDIYEFLDLTPGASLLYVAGPVYDDSGRPAGVILVGKRLSMLAVEMGQDLSADVSLYAMDGQLLSSTMPAGSASYVQMETLQSAFQNQAQTAITRKAAPAKGKANEILSPWRVRKSEQIGLIGLTLPDLPDLSISSGLWVEVGAAFALALGMVWLVGLLLARLFNEPILRLLKATGEVNRGNLVTKVDVSGNDELSILTHSFNEMLLGFQQNILYRDLLGYAPTEDIREEMRRTFETEGFNLRGQQIDVSILISDVHDFTSMTHDMRAEDAVAILNEYFEQLAAIVVSHNGVINKLEGDAIIVIFGALPHPLTPEESAREACLAAAAMLLAIRSFNKKNIQKGLPVLVTGISIHTGPVILGGLTIRDQFHYTPIGEAVRTAHHLEQLTSQISSKSDIFISQGTFELLDPSQQEYRVENLGQFAVKEDGAMSSVYRLVPLHEAGL